MIDRTELDSPMGLLTRGNFFRVWFSGFLIGTTRWLDVLAVSIFVYDVTGSALIVAMTMFLRMLPMLLFGAFAGAFAETVECRKLLIGGLLIVALAYGLLALLAWKQLLHLWQLTMCVFLSGVFWALEMPVRRTMVAEIAGLKNISAAMGLDTATNNFTRIIGPFCGGVLYEFSGLHGAIALGASLYFLSALLLMYVRYDREFSDFEKSSIISNMVEGVRYACSNRLIIGVFVVTIIFNFFGFACVSMVPVIAREELGSTPFLVGILSSGEGVGAFIGSILVAFFVLRNRFNQVYFFGAIIYIFCLGTFAISPVYWVSFLALWFAGFGAAGFSSMQSAIIILNSPPRMRNRLMGVLTMCIGAGPIGILVVGFLANYFGTDKGVLITSLLGLIASFGVGVIWPELLKIEKS